MSLPSDGIKLRLMRILDGKFAFTSKDVAKWLDLSLPQACKYINELQVEHKIVFSHKDARQIFYKVLRNEVR
jgi:hypothetical protein